MSAMDSIFVLQPDLTAFGGNSGENRVLSEPSSAYSVDNDQFSTADQHRDKLCEETALQRNRQRRKRRIQRLYGPKWTVGPEDRSDSEQVTTSRQRATVTGSSSQHNQKQSAQEDVKPLLDEVYKNF